MKAEYTRNAMSVFRNEATLKAIDKELTELERLALIGKSLEWLVQTEGMYQRNINGKPSKFKINIEQHDIDELVYYYTHQEETKVK